MTATVAGLVLAAGAGTRFGIEPKLLVVVDGRPLLQHAVDAMTAVGEIDPVVVVLGFQADRLRAEIDFGRARTTLCPNWAEGLSASLRCGVDALSEPARVLVALADTPGVNRAVILRLLACAPGSRASYNGTPGHPVLLGPDHLDQLGGLRGDVGARELLRDGPLVECGDLASGADVDTPADLANLRVGPSD